MTTHNLAAFNAYRNCLQRVSLTWAINTQTIFKPEHRAVMGTHHDFSAPGMDHAGLCIQSYGKMRAAVAVSPDISIPAYQHELDVFPIQYGLVNDRRPVGNRIQCTQHLHAMARAIITTTCNGMNGVPS